MGIRKFGPKGSTLASIRFSHLINFLSLYDINNYIKSSISKKVDKKESLINWVEFDLKPTQLSRVYKILIVYVEGYVPSAYIVTPSLNSLKDSTDIIPHLYDHTRYKLCLHYPYTNDYNSKEEIGQQYIPWIKLWLYYFEEWLYSKEWKGGGVEVGDETDLEFNPKHNSNSETNKEINYNYSARNEANKIYDRRLKIAVKEIENERL